MCLNQEAEKCQGKKLVMAHVVVELILHHSIGLKVIPNVRGGPMDLPPLLLNR